MKSGLCAVLLLSLLLPTVVVEAQKAPEIPLLVEVRVPVAPAPVGGGANIGRASTAHRRIGGLPVTDTRHSSRRSVSPTAGSCSFALCRVA